MSSTEPDADGPAAPPRRNGELAFDHPWQSRLFATTMALCDNGTLTYDEFRLRLIAEIRHRSEEQRPDEQRPDEQRPDEQRPDEQRPDEQRADEYWSSWQDALEELLTDRELLDPSQLAERARRFAEHG